jgi:magnesium-protoporphyrin IX monomethyl ester (oxidative) cyclase
MNPSTDRNIDLITITPGSQGEMDRKHIPLGILYVGSNLKKYGYNVRLHHILPNEIDVTVRHISSSKPLWIGMSVLSGMTTYWSALASKKLKMSCPDIPIVWGGPHATLCVHECLLENYVNIVVRGEGELTSIGLSEALLNSGNYIDNLQKVDGISFKTNQQEIIHNKDRNLIQNLDELPLDFSLLRMDHYVDTEKMRTVSFFSSRGCPFNCAFCSTPRFFNKTYRFHSEEYVIEKISYLKTKNGINTIYFSDDNFYLEKKRARRIIERMKEREVRCGTLDVRLDQLNEEDLHFFKDNNVYGLFFGWESGNDRLLKLMRKQLSVDQIRYKADLIEKHKITSWGSGIILLPTESFDEVMNTIRFSMELRKKLKGSVISVFRFMPLPKTDFTSLAISEGFKLPVSQEDWRKIDPLEPFYKVEWIPWYTKEMDLKFRYVQELSRNNISVYIQDGILGKVKNYFADRINKKMMRLDFQKLWEKKLYELLLILYSFFRRKKIRPIKTRILD